jgi:hypothetical protein
MLRIPVGWQEVNSRPAVFTPAPWRANFRRGIPVTVYFHGRRLELVGILDGDPDHVAAAMRCVAERHGSLRRIGVSIPRGHQPTAADAVAVNRALITFAAR